MHPIACANCKQCAARHACNNCLITAYCGKPCQQAHWEAGHNQRCGQILIRIEGKNDGGKRAREEDCHNEDDPITMEPVPDTHFDVWVGDKKYCFDIVSLAKWITSNGKYSASQIRQYTQHDLDSVIRPKNPMTGTPFTNEELLRFADAYDAYIAAHPELAEVPYYVRPYTLRLTLYDVQDAERNPTLIIGGQNARSMDIQIDPLAEDAAVTVSRETGNESLYFVDANNEDHFIIFQAESAIVLSLRIPSTNKQTPLLTVPYTFIPFDDLLGGIRFGMLSQYMERDQPDLYPDLIMEAQRESNEPVVEILIGLSHVEYYEDDD